MVTLPKVNDVVKYTALEKIGLVFVTVITFKSVVVLVRLLYNNVVRPLLGPRLQLKDMGEWAAVTGPCEGLGKAYACALAKEGLNIILISRCARKAESFAAEIELQFRVRTAIIEADLDSDSVEMYSRLERGLCGRDVGVLVNNMSTTYPHPEYFLDLPRSERIYTAIVHCNVMAVTRLTRTVLPGMIKRGRGTVINVSSTAALIPCPLLAVYAASKAFIVKFSTDVAAEVEGRGIIVQCVTPGYVASGTGASVTKASWLVPTPERYVQSALTRLGGDCVTTAYGPHSFLVSVIECIRDVSPTLAARTVLKGMEEIRARAVQRYVT